MSAALNRFAELLVQAQLRVVWNSAYDAFKFCCPLHDDRTPSADARIGDRVPVIGSCQICGAEGGLPEMLKQLGATDADRDLILGGQPSRNGAGATEIVHHVYRHSDGIPALRVVRELRAGKTTKLRRQYFYAGEWCWPKSMPKPAIPNTRALLYNLPEVIEAVRQGATVYLAEGERCCDALIALGLPATCNVGGASEPGKVPKWTRVHAQQLMSAGRAVIFEDHDPTGVAHGQAEGETLTLAGVTDVRTVRFPELREHGDVLDWLGQLSAQPLEERRQALLDLVERAPRWQPSPVNAPEVGVNLTDLGNAERLVARFADQMRYCAAWTSWMTFDGRRWTRDRDGAVDRHAIETVRSIYGESEKLDDLGERKARARHALASEAAGRIRAMIELARSDARVAIIPEAFDAHPRTRYLLNVQNGTLDVRTGELRSHQPEDLITRTAPVRFDPAARCDRFEKFLQRALPDPEVRGFVQRFAGSCLTGDASDRRVVLACGSGDNGKSVFAGALSQLLGDYAHAARFDSFLESRPDRPGGARSDLMALQGARLVIAIEANPGRHFNEALLKTFAGGGSDRITARGLYERDDTTFPPEGKLLLVCNHRPEVKGGGDAIWNRLLEIPFTVVIPKVEQDPQLVDRLCEELSGILNWALSGARLWWATCTGDRLQPPDAVIRATADYRESEDPLGGFIADRCILDPSAAIPTKALWNAYLTWCLDVGETIGLGPAARPPISRRKFTEVLVSEHRLVRATIGHQNVRGLRGIRLPDAFDDAPQKPE